MRTLEIIVENVSFESEGYILRGRTYRPATQKKYPAVINCHGFPGDNKSMDLAEELAFNGFATLIFYYRGAWESEGKYSFKALDSSTASAIEFFMCKPFVDPKRLGLTGSSMGTLPLAKRLSIDKRIRTGVFMSPVGDISHWITPDGLEYSVNRFYRMGEGKLKSLSKEQLRVELPWAYENINPQKDIKNTTIPILVTTIFNRLATIQMASFFYRWQICLGFDKIHGDLSNSILS